MSKNKGFFLVSVYATYTKPYNVEDFMKSTGIVRKLDELGRIVLPIELRRTLNLAEKDAVEIYVDGENIILRKYQPNCVFCGEGKNLVDYKGKMICAKCAKTIFEKL